MEKNNEDDFMPRDYQTQLVEMCLKQNTIIYLPTGSGKTYIAAMVLKNIAGQHCTESFNQGGKLCVMLVNTVTLVDQQSKFLSKFIHLRVGAYSGDKGVDDWSAEKWNTQFETNQVLVMTSQILLNLIEFNFLGLERVALLIFDECHRGVNDHSMRQIMINFEKVAEPPRVIGLTATLLNRNCKPTEVASEVKALEVTFHSQVATVDKLQDVLGFSTNPTEYISTYAPYILSDLDSKATGTLKKLILTLAMYTKEKKNLKTSLPPNCTYLDKLPPDANDIIKILKDCIIHIEMLGTFGGKLSMTAHIIQLERMRKRCQDFSLSLLLDSALTTLCVISKIFQSALDTCSKKQQIHKFSSANVNRLLDIIKENKKFSIQTLCGIIFVERRFTAKILYYILLEASKHDSELQHIKPNYIVGFNNQPFNDTRESLLLSKHQRKILHEFENGDINLLVASNVIEEGIDIRLCSLVVKFDEPKDYRSYIQSKGRARSKSSSYYIMTNETSCQKFYSQYQTFKNVENTLNEYLIGKNEIRNSPSRTDIQNLYNENIIPPYYVDGPNSAHVSLVSAISLLCRYCVSLLADKYTTLAPNWYITNENKVVIELPMASPILEPIYGPIMFNKKLAKRAAALKAVEILHKAGELDDQLLPISPVVVEEDLSSFFLHWPEIKEKEAGNNKTRRSHNVEVPQVCQGLLCVGKQLYLHVIQLSPVISKTSLENESNKKMFEMYTSSLCYGILSAQRWPNLCQFSLHVSLAEILVYIDVNKKTVVLTDEDIRSLKVFHRLVFNDVLSILRPFLLFDSDENAEGLLVVPIEKSNFNINFDVVKNNQILKDNGSTPLKNVSEENYLGTIISPTYRQEEKNYLVTDVCTYLNAHSKFPSNDVDTYETYYKEKYGKMLRYPDQPLLLVKSLSKRINLLKPRGVGGKRNKELLYEDIEEHLLAELCVKKDFPACLWIQASLLPSVLHRAVCLLKAEQLRKVIQMETMLGSSNDGKQWQPLVLDARLISYEYKKIPKEKSRIRECDNVDDEAVISSVPNNIIVQFKTDYVLKKLESEYPWQEKDEPIDIERHLDITLMDIHDYENFIHQKVSMSEKMAMCSPSQKKPNILPITFDRTFVEKKINFLNNFDISKGPELGDVLQALTTAKSNDIVNLERLETLGDSFLKLAISLFIYLKYPKYSEGKATSFKGKLISNKNLYYAGISKNLGGYLKICDFSPKYEWKPPYFCVPKPLRQKIEECRLELVSLVEMMFSEEEQLCGTLSNQSENDISNRFIDVLKDDKNCNENVVDSLLTFINMQKVSDKTVADCVEALIGLYFKSCGFIGGLKLLEWFEIIPKSENIAELLNWTPPNPLLKGEATCNEVFQHITFAEQIEETLNYKFKNRAYLLQALTHCSYARNRLTQSYERLEFLGDAILDFLITCHIFETCDNLNPGQLTDLRSALVNNITFAGFTVRCGFQKFLLFCNKKLSDYIDNFVQYQESRDFVIDDAILVLLEEDELHLAEHVDVPKVLGDIFEALAGAVFLDSDCDLNCVWSVFYKIMWKEIDMFRANVPKSAVRNLYEMPGTYPEFNTPVEKEETRTMVELSFMLFGARKTVYGFGENKILAKRAAAKLALRLLSP